jgi:heterodisulfide reductase subunit A
VILSMAAVPAISANGQRVPGLALTLDENGFYQSSDAELAPMESNLPGVFLAGASVGPKDIPETVAQASGAAAKVLGMFRQALR